MKTKRWKLGKNCIKVGEKYSWKKFDKDGLKLHQLMQKSGKIVENCVKNWLKRVKNEKKKLVENYEKNVNEWMKIDQNYKKNCR